MDIEEKTQEGIDEGRWRTELMPALLAPARQGTHTPEGEQQASQPDGSYISKEA